LQQIIPAKRHEVLAKETPYGIAKLYGISLKELNEVNPTLEATENRSKIILPAQASSPEIAVAAKFTETGNLTQSKLQLPFCLIQIFNRQKIRNYSKRIR
jgi:hypothetical protein